MGGFFLKIDCACSHILFSIVNHSCPPELQNFDGIKIMRGKFRLRCPLKDLRMKGVRNIKLAWGTVLRKDGIN